MESRQTIMHFIDEMYSMRLKELDITELLSQLKSWGPFAYSIIFDLIPDSDSDKKEFLFSLLGEIGDRNIIQRLMGIVNSSTYDDETKLLAAVTIHHMGGHLEYRQLRSKLSNPHDLGKKIVKNILRKSEDPQVILTFLENFPYLEKEGRYTALRDLQQITGEEKIVNIVGPLSEIADDDLQRMIIPVLLNSHSKRAYYYLQRIIKISTSKEIHSLARKAIFKLGQYIHSDTTIAQAKHRIHSAYTTVSDGAGSVIFLISFINSKKKIIVFDFVCNDKLGIKDAFGVTFSTSEYSKHIKKFKEEKQFLVVKIDPYYVIEKAKYFEELTANVQRQLPLEYVAFRTLFDQIDVNNKELNDQFEKFEQFKFAALEEKDVLLSKTPDLYNYNEVKSSWFIEFETIAPYVEQYVNIHIKAEEKSKQKIQHEISKLYIKTGKVIFKKEFIKLLVSRLNDYAFLSFIDKKQKRSKLAIVAAETLVSMSPIRHPFLLEMLEFSFKVHLKAGEDELLIDDHLERQVQHFDNEYKEYETFAAEGSSLAKILAAEFSNYSEWEKLLIISQKLPKSSFAEHFSEAILDMDIEQKIKHLNFLESVYGVFIEFYTGIFDWEKLRHQLDVKIDNKIESSAIKEIRQKLLETITRKSYNENYKDIVLRIFRELIFLSNGKLEPMIKPLSWAAGIEFIVNVLYLSHSDIESLSIEYSVSNATIRKRAKQICDLLNIKLYHAESHRYAFLYEEY